MFDSKSKLGIIKNLIVMCLGFLLLFCAFQSLANLQSTMNNEGGLGVASQSVIYAALICSALFLPHLVIRKLGCKWTLVASILVYCPYIAANFAPSVGTFLLTAVLLGLGGGTLWPAKSTYLSEISRQYAILTNVGSDVIISRFFGVFYTFFQTTQIWGNLVSYYVLKPGNVTQLNDVDEKKLAFCGINFCVESNVTNQITRPDQKQRSVLIGIYLGCGLAAALVIALFLDPLERRHNDVDDTSVSERLVATFRHMKKTPQMLLIPLTVYNGIEHTFFISDFTSAYIACSWGTYHVGYVFICYGIVNSLLSFVSGRLLGCLPRFVMIAVAFAGNVVVIVTMFLWTPDPRQSYMFFVMAGIWGLSEAIWQTQLNALYSSLFDGDVAAFGNFILWQSVGCSIAFALSKWLCVATKLFVVLAFLVLGAVGYFAVEIGRNMGMFGTVPPTVKDVPKRPESTNSTSL